MRSTILKGIFLDNKMQPYKFILMYLKRNKNSELSSRFIHLIYSLCVCGRGVWFGNKLVHMFSDFCIAYSSPFPPPVTVVKYTDISNIMEKRFILFFNLKYSSSWQERPESRNWKQLTFYLDYQEEGWEQACYYHLLCFHLSHHR